jgi:hypothetical protein
MLMGHGQSRTSSLSTISGLSPEFCSSRRENRRITAYILVEVMMDSQMLSLGQVAQKLGVASFRIVYAITNQLVPDASARFAGRRVFTEEDVQRIAVHFGVESRLNESRKETQ